MLATTETHSPNKYENTKENSGLSADHKQMSVNKEIVGFQPEITNLDEMFDFKQIDKIVKEFDIRRRPKTIIKIL